MAGFMDMQRVAKLWQYLDPEEVGTLDRDAVIAALVGDAPNLNADVIAEGVPDVLTDADHLRVLSERVDSYVGVAQQTQVSAARRGLWDGVCARVFADTAAAGNAAAAADAGGGGGGGGSAGGGGLTYYDVKELVADIGYVMRGEGVKLEGVDTELAMLAMDEAAGDEAVASPTSVVAPPQVLVAGMCELGELAPVAAAVRCLKVAAERRGQAEKHQVEGLVDQLGAEVDARYGELEIRAPVAHGFDDGVFQAGRRPIRALSDEEVEVLERPSRAAGLPRRARLAPFSPDAELTEDILMETLACWYSKTLDADSPTVVDELVANLRVPKKTEGDDVGDPIAVIAEAAFALHSRLGPSHPHLGPAAMVTLWMLSMEGVDVDRLLKFHDVPPLTLAAGSGGSSGGSGGEDADAPPDAAAAVGEGAGGEEDAAAVLASLHDEYAKRYAGKRNQAVLQEVTLAMRDVRESLVLPTTAVRVTVSTLAGLNHAFARESVFVEVSVKGQGTQGTRSLPHAASMAYEQELLFPMVAASAHVRLTLMTTTGVTIGSADLRYPEEEEGGSAAPAAAAAAGAAAAAPQTLSVTAMPVVGREGAARQPKLADLTVSVGHASLTPEDMVALVESLGGDLQRQRAGAKLMKWAKVCCLLQALSGPLGAPAFRGAAATAAAAAQHASLEAGAYYATLPPCVASADEAVARAAADGAAHPVELRMPDAEGVDASALSFYPEEATVLVAPFSQYEVADVARRGDAGATVALQHRRLLGSAGLAAPAALQRFYHACLHDLRRADQQLHDAYDRVLAEKSRHLHHLVTDGDVRVRVREEAAPEEAPLRETTPDHLFERLVDRLLPLPEGCATAHLPHAPTPLAMCVERAAMPHLLSELILLWYDKEGDIVDELMANLSLPSETSALAALAQLSSFLADCHADQPRNWAEVLTLVLLAVEGADIDSLCMLEDTPRTFSTAAEKQEYVNRVGSSRNPAVLSQLSVALGGMTDYQLSASLAAQGANSVRKAALMEPHRVQKEVVRKWIKTLGMMLILCEPHDGSELHRRAAPAPGETERMLALRTGPWCLWPAPSRCSKDPGAPPSGAADAALKVHCVVKGLTAALDLTPYQRRHRQGDETPAIVIPPLTSFLVGEVERPGENELRLELLTRETTATVNPAVKRWRAAIERSSARADQRLRDAFYDLGVAKHAQILERNAVTMGKRVVLPDERTVMGTLGEMKEYKLLVHDEVLPTHCGRASVGTVGNVTEAVTTDIPDLRRNLRNLAAEMRGEELLELEEPEEERPRVVSVRFDDDAVYVLPIDLLAVHPITWMPAFPATLRVVVRWAELPDDGASAPPPAPRVRFEVDGAPHVTHITGDPKLPAAPASELSASGAGAVIAWDGGATTGGGGGGSVEPQPPCQPGESGHVPVWEEAFTVDVDRLRLADAPLALTFVAFAEQDEEDVDEYEYDRGDDTADHTEETTVVGTAALAVSHHVLLETVGRRRTFPLVLSRADHHLMDEVHTIAGHTIANSLMYGNRAGGGGMLYVSLEVVPETEDAKSESSDEMATRVADPLSWRAGEFATDRICTGCDAGEDECVEAVYVCLHCDEKLCEDCWDAVHRPQSRREDHTKLLLFHHCDFCYVDHEGQDDDAPGAAASSAAGAGAACTADGTAALWRCEECSLNLCKNCWFSEHKHPARRCHHERRTFLYPGGEEGPWAYTTVLAQTVSCCNERFACDALTWKQPGPLACNLCLESDAVFSWPHACPGGEGTLPLVLCAPCMLREAQDVEDDALDAELAGVPRAVRPPLSLLLERCLLCRGLEGRPAEMYCAECNFSLCAPCWRAQHRHPLRRAHKQETVAPPPAAMVPHSDAAALMAKVTAALAKMRIVVTVEPPQLNEYKGPVPRIEWSSDLRDQDAALRRPAAAEDAAAERGVFSTHDGYIGSGADLGAPERLTLEQAKERCLALPRCQGFTYKVPPGAGSSTLLKVFFKEKFNLQGQGSGWTSVRKRREGGLCTHGALPAYCGDCQAEVRRDELADLAAGGGSGDGGSNGDNPAQPARQKQRAGGGRPGGQQTAKRPPGTAADVIAQPVLAVPIEQHLKNLIWEATLPEGFRPRFD